MAVTCHFDIDAISAEGEVQSGEYAKERFAL